MRNCNKTNFIIFILFVLLFNSFRAQNSWNEKAKAFVSEASMNRYKYTINEVRSAIETSSSLIKTVSGNSSGNIQSSLYLARANLRIYVLEWQKDSADGNFTPPVQSISAVKADFLKAQVFCSDCKCGMYENILSFYASYGNTTQLDSLEKEAKTMGRPTEHTFIGVDLNYIPQKNIAGISLGFLDAWTVLQPKKWTNAAGKRSRKCKYDYPTALGFFSVGYETSLDNRKYNAVKIDPIWFNYIFAIHPFQVIYGDHQLGKLLIYRPEFGVSFSTFSVNYALNLYLKGSSDALNTHNISVRFCIPAIKLH